VGGLRHFVTLAGEGRGRAGRRIAAAKR